MLCNVDWWLVTEVLEQPICPMFKGQAVEEDCKQFLDQVSDYQFLKGSSIRNVVSVNERKH
jgi:hypothetical protein